MRSFLDSFLVKGFLIEARSPSQSTHIEKLIIFWTFFLEQVLFQTSNKHIFVGGYMEYNFMQCHELFCSINTIFGIIVCGVLQLRPYVQQCFSPAVRVFKYTFFTIVL